MSWFSIIILISELSAFKFVPVMGKYSTFLISAILSSYSGFSAISKIDSIILICNILLYTKLIKLF
jgi:hypothetical protein